MMELMKELPQLFGGANLFFTKNSIFHINHLLDFVLTCCCGDIVVESTTKLVAGISVTKLSVNGPKAWVEH